MCRPSGKLIGLATVAWFTMLTLFGHALHDLDGHAPHRADCETHACHQDKAESPGPVLEASHGERCSTHGECTACEYFSKSQQALAGAVAVAGEPSPEPARATSPSPPKRPSVAGYEPRGPPVPHAERLSPNV